MLDRTTQNGIEVGISFFEQGGQWALLHADCMRAMAFLGDESFDAVVTDPPYGIDYDSGWRRKVLPKLGKIANDERPFIWWLWDAYRVVKEGGHLLCFCRWDVAEAFRLAIEWAGFTVKSQVIWDRGLHGLGDLDGQFAPQHDIIWHAAKGRAELYGTRPKSVIKIMRPHAESLTHQNEKPVALMRYLVRAVCPKDGTILDPFAGTASTIKAARLEGMRAMGIELKQETYQMSLDALRKPYTMMMDLEEVEAELMAERETEEEAWFEEE